MRGFAVATVVASLITGCVSVGPAEMAPETTSPAATPPLSGGAPLSPTAPVSVTSAPTTTPAQAASESPGVEPTVTFAAPTEIPTVHATAQATAVPTDQPSALPTEQPTEQPTQSPPANHAVLRDELADPNSGWAVFDEDFARAAYEGGTLALSIPGEHSWAYTTRHLGDAHAVVRTAADITPSADGWFGLLCGTTQGRYAGALVGTDGSWIVIWVDGNGTGSYARDDDAGLDVPVGTRTLIGVECAGTPAGGLRLILYVDGAGVVATHETPEGFGSFDRVGLYAEGSGGFTASMNEVAAWAVGGTDGALSAEAADLLGHIPPSWQPDCVESPLPVLLGGPAIAALNCFLRPATAAGAELAQYARFGEKAAMDAEYGARVAEFPITSRNDSCRDGEAEDTYAIEAVDAGRLLCAPQDIGIRFDWTDDRTRILSTLVDFDGDFAATFADWLEAGPSI